MRVKTEVRVFRAQLYCDICGEKMKFTGAALATYQEQFTHKCKNEHVDITNKIYPCIEYDDPEDYDNSIKEPHT